MTQTIRVAHVATVDLTLRFLLLGQLRRLRDEGFDVTLISAPGPWVAGLEVEGFRHIPWPHATRAWDPPADLRAFIELVRIFRRERFDILHTHNPKPGVLGRIAGRLTSTPCIVNTVHGLYATPEDPASKRLPVMGVERLAALCSDLELYQSQEDLSWARRLGIVGSGRSMLLGNGTDLSVFDPSALTTSRCLELRRELSIPDDAIVVGTVGRIVAEKGYREFVLAARVVRDARPEVRFLAVGSTDGAKADAIGEQEIRRARSDVTFTGWREDVRDLLALMDVFVLPSWREGFPRSAIEAAAMGKALVLSDIRGCREVAEDGKEALFVPAKDPYRLAEAILRLVREPDLRTRLGAAARRRAVERFDERGVADRVLVSYSEVLRRKGFRREPVVGRGLVLRPARSSDVAAMARLHRESLPAAFLTSLGDGVLRSLYRALVADGQAVALVAEEQGRVLGFAAATTSVRAFFRRFSWRHGPRVAIAAAPRLLRPFRLRGLRETASYPGRAVDLPDAELLSVAVASRDRRRGVGAELVRDLLDRLGALGADRVKVVVGADNEPANRFYASLGFRHCGRIAVHDGVPSNVWVIRCHSSSLSRSQSS